MQGQYGIRTSRVTGEAVRDSSRYRQIEELRDLPEDRAATILSVILRGWEIAKKTEELQSGTRENTLNEKLRRGMKTAVNREVPLGTMPMMRVGWTELILSSNEVAEPDAAPDIPVSFPDIWADTHNPGPHACIECKRIDGTKRRRQYYIEEGVDRFKKGKYATLHGHGFMAGYLDSGDASAAATGINEFLDEKHRQDEKLGPATVSVSDAEQVRSSQHARNRGSAPIEIHHMFLAFG